jgi:hypothetical protein
MNGSNNREPGYRCRGCLDHICRTCLDYIQILSPVGLFTRRLCQGQEIHTLLFQPILFPEFDRVNKILRPAGRLFVFKERRPADEMDLDSV